MEEQITEQEIWLGVGRASDIILDTNKDIGLVTALEIERVVLKMTHKDFAREELGMHPNLWTAWKQGNPPTKVVYYVNVLRNFPGLRAKVFRYLDWLAAALILPGTTLR